MINIAEFLDNHFKYILDSWCKLTCISLGFPLQWLNEDIMSLIKNVDFACSFVHLKTEKSTGRLSLKNMCQLPPLLRKWKSASFVIIIIIIIIIIMIMIIISISISISIITAIILVLLSLSLLLLLVLLLLYCYCYCYC